MSVPAGPVRARRTAVALLGRVLLGLDLRWCRVAGQVHGGLRGAELVQDVRVELVGELAAHFDYFACAAVVSQSSRHLLVSHGLAVALTLSPALSQLLFIFGDKVESSAAAVRPLDRVAHAGVVQGLMEVFIKSELFTT